MNIIEAIQRAEDGKLITNNFLKLNNCFLKYVKAGVFYKYQVTETKPIFQSQVENFSMGEVLNISWEVLSDTPFNEVTG